MSGDTSDSLHPAGKYPRNRLSSYVHAQIWERGRACYVELAKINRSDTRFQCRLLASTDDLVASIRERGQHTPVLLWGSRSPYVIIDGFRRIQAIASLGGPSVLAAFEETADETRAFALSFSENACRKNLSAYDRANAIWQGMNRWKIPKRDLAGLLGLSIRQVDRYLRLLSFDEPIREALAQGRIGMAHAVVLYRRHPPDPQKWIRELELSGLSASQLQRRLRSSAARRPRSYLVREANGFRLRSIRYTHTMSPALKERILEALDSARRIVTGE